jgi:hypothetical protein
MQHVARNWVLMAHDGNGRLQVADAVEVQASQNAADRSGAQACGTGNAKSGAALATKLLHEVGLVSLRCCADSDKDRKNGRSNHPAPPAENGGPI